MTDILVDRNIILDILTEDPQWFEWSAQKLTDYADRGALVINPIIYAEISIGCSQP
jgi:predicted nucleic acid-binding protein